MSLTGRTAVDVGRGGGCVFRAVSQQLYGSPKNHFYVHSVGIQYLGNHPNNLQRVTLSILDKVIWKECHVKEHGLMQIMIQAVANCLNLSIRIAESNPTLNQ